MTDDTRSRPGQADGAAERSAHVLRGGGDGEVLGPCVEVSPGVWRLRALVEAEARIAELAGALFRMEDLRQAYREGAEAMRDAAVKACRVLAYSLKARPVPYDVRLSEVAEDCAHLIGALPLPEGGE